MFLTNEEFGMLIRKLMIEDDEEGFRYDVDKDIKTEYLNCEKTWLNEFEEAKKNNPILKQAYMILRGQTQKSRKAFDQLEFLGYDIADAKEWYKKKAFRDQSARRQYFDIERNRRQRGDLYITTILDEEMKPSDSRLR